MEEKKLTDEGIAKAILQNIEYGKTITYFDEWGNCKTVMVADVLDLIHRLKKENEELKSPKFASWKLKFFNLKEKFDKELAEHEEFTKKANAEIERLTEWKDKLQDTKDELEQQLIDTGFKEYCEENAELQKQVDELKEELENMQAVIFGLEEDKRLLQKQVDELKTENTELYKEHTTVIAGSILQKSKLSETRRGGGMMEVKKIIKGSAELLGIELTGENTEILLACYNIVENELATRYFLLSSVDKLLIQDDKIKYSDLKHNAYRILSVMNIQSDEVKYKLFPKYLELQKNYNGHYFFVRYNYIPKDKTIDDSCEYDERMEQVLKYGICCEYCLQVGEFETGSEFDKQYKKLIKDIYWKRK